MNTQTVGAACVPLRSATRRRPALSRTATFWLLASITVTFLAGSSAPTPLYPIYQSLWRFSPITITVVFGVYAFAVLAALLFLGRLSDHVGRRPVLIVAALAQAVAMIVLASADGVTALLVGRTIQGLATGAAIAAVGAGMIDLDRARGTLANAIAPISGTALGALVGGLTVHFLPDPTQTIYLVLGILFLAQGAGLAFMSETAAPLPGALGSLMPRLAMPSAVRTPMLVALPVLVAVWALGGFYGSLGPALVRQVFGLDASLFGGLALFVLAGSGAAAVLVLHARAAASLMTIGASLLVGGVALALAGVSLASIALFFAGTAIAGAGFGVAFQGAIRTIVLPAAAHERAGVLSIAFIVSYVSMGMPAMVAGAALVEGAPLLTTTRDFGAGVMVLALLALIGTRLRAAPA